MKTRGELLWAALPGTSRELIARTGIYRKSVQSILREWLRERKIRKYTRWSGSQSYTWVYDKVDAPLLSRPSPR